MNKWFLIACIPITLLIFFIILGPNPKAPPTTTPFITANPLDLTQTKAISQFRSCEGHNYSGNNSNGEEETYRTMKHYIETTDQLSGTARQVKIFAPFDGNISRIASDNRGTQVYLSPNSKENNWNFIFFHIDLLPKFKKKSAIVAGDHIGYANLKNAANFDIAMRNFGLGNQFNDSPFLYMTENVLAEYKSVGLTLENIVISKEERDASPCQLAPGEEGRDAFFTNNASGKNWITLQN